MIQDSRDRSASEVLKDIIGNAQEMIRSEVRLAKAEVREEVTKTLDGAKLLGAGAGAGLFALGFVLVAVAQFLAQYMPGWAATLVVGVVLGIAAAVMISSGKGRVKVPTPDKTIENVKENVEWVKNQTKS
jgi:uncharacterized membrane protein YqjE